MRSIEVNTRNIEIGADIFGPYFVLDPIAEWCNLNTTDKYRIHYFRVTSLLDDDSQSNFTLRQLKTCHGYSAPNSAVSEKIVVAFKNKDDAMMFTIAWS